MLKNLAYALKLERAGIKPITIVDLSSDKEFMERYEKSAEVIKKFLLDKENFEKQTRLDRVFGPSYFLGYSTS